MKYKKGFKYQVYEKEPFNTGIIGYQVKTDWLKLERDGTLYCLKGYAWDGPSGPSIHTRNFMRGSLVHDALYELMRKGLILKSFKDEADRLLVRVCREDGMSKIRSKWIYEAVKRFGKNSLLKPKKVYSSG